MEVDVKRERDRFASDWKKLSWMAEMTQPEDVPEFDTVEELAEFFRVSPSSVRRAINKNQVRAFRIGGSIRIPRAERERLSISDQK